MGFKSISVTALKDDARVLGLVLENGRVIAIDVMDEQLPSVQAAIDSGDVSVAGMSATAPKGKGK